MNLNRARVLSLASLALLMLAMVAPLTLASQAGPCQGADLDVGIMEAYAQLLDTYSATGWVPETAIAQLNTAIEKANQADLIRATDPYTANALDNEAQQIASQASQELLSAKYLGLEQKFWGYGIVAISAIIAGALAFGVYRFGPTMMWKSWLRLRGGQIAKPGSAPVENKPGDEDEEGNDQPVTMENVSAIVALALVVIAAFIVAQPILAGMKGEQFSELGVLGPNMMIGDYPTTVAAGSNISLYSYVGNHMGEPVWYRMLVKLGDNGSQVDPFISEPIYTVEKVLADNETWISSINISPSVVGNDQRLIFELWSINSSSHNLDYAGRWNQLWINVTYPILNG